MKVVEITIRYYFEEEFTLGKREKGESNGRGRLNRRGNYPRGRG